MGPLSILMKINHALPFTTLIIAAANVVIQTKKKTLGSGEGCSSGCFFTYVKRD